MLGAHFEMSGLKIKDNLSIILNAYLFYWTLLLANFYFTATTLMHLRLQFYEWYNQNRLS